MAGARLGRPARGRQRFDEIALRQLVERPERCPAFGVRELGGAVAPRIALTEKLLVGDGQLAPQTFTLGLEPAPERLAADVIHLRQEVAVPPLDGAGRLAPGEILLELAGVEPEAGIEADGFALEDETAPKQPLDIRECLAKRLPGARLRPVLPQEGGKLGPGGGARRPTRQVRQERELLPRLANAVEPPSRRVTPNVWRIGVGERLPGAVTGFPMACSRVRRGGET